jgi:hypothetical protein
MRYLIIAAGLLCFHPGLIPWATAQEKDAPAAAQQAPETVRLHIPSSTTYATETEVPLKTALLEWVVTTTHHKHYDEGFTALVIVLSNLEMGCQAFQPGRYGPYIPELAKEVELPVAQKESDFLIRLSYAMKFEPRKTDRGLLGELVFGKESKEFKPLPTFEPPKTDSGVPGELAFGKESKEIKPLRTLAVSSLNFHFLYYSLNHLSAKNHYYQSKLLADPMGGSALVVSEGKMEWHFDVYPAIMGDLHNYPGVLVLTKQDGATTADLNFLGTTSGFRGDTLNFAVRGKLRLTECPTSVNAYDLEKNKK